MAASTRYKPLLRLAAGGMATVHVGAATGGLGFRQLVAIKRPHPHLLEVPGYRRSFLEEAQVAARIRHANVVDIRDVEDLGDDLYLVMDYIEGASLSVLLTAAKRAGRSLPPAVCIRIVLDAAAGLHAAHELEDDEGVSLRLVHRDVSPQNILVGTDGVSRITDFGIAKFERPDAYVTTEGVLKGKFRYMAPEYLRGHPIDRGFDVFGLAVVLREAIDGHHLFDGESEVDTFQRLLSWDPPPFASYRPELACLDDALEAALTKDPRRRFQSAAAFAMALESSARAHDLVARADEVAKSVASLLGEDLAARRRELVRLGSLDAASAASGSVPSSGEPAQVEVAAPVTSGSAQDKTQSLPLAVASPPALAESNTTITSVAGVPRGRSPVLVVAAVAIAVAALGAAINVAFDRDHGAAEGGGVATVKSGPQAAVSGAPSADRSGSSAAVAPSAAPSTTPSASHTVVLTARSVGPASPAVSSRRAPPPNPY